MLARSAESITKADIDRFIDSQIRESRICDYKELLPSNKDDDKKEFLADVTSFANAGGGTIFYGIIDKRDAAGKSTGLPESVGLSSINADQETLRLEQIMAAGVAPRILGVRIHSVDGFERGPMIVLQIPQSWTGPHMVTYQRWSRFYSRNSGGKQQLDVQEIRAAFASAEAIPERIKRFRDDRLARIFAGETPVSLRDSSWLAFHIVPISSTEQHKTVDIHAIYRDPAKLRPARSQNYSMRYNMDGVCVWTGSGDTLPAAGYTQIFRTGVVESVITKLIFEYDNESYVRNRYLEDSLIEITRQCLLTLSSLGIEAPFVLMVSIFGTKGALLERFADSSRFGLIDPSHYRIDRNILTLPDIWIEDTSPDASAVLRPMFDALWQAAGAPNCLNYSADGNRVPER